MTQDPVPDNTISIVRSFEDDKTIYTITSSNGKAQVQIGLVTDGDIETQIFLDTVINQQFASAMLFEFSRSDMNGEEAGEEK